MKKILIGLSFLSQVAFGQITYGLKGGLGDAWYNGGQGNQYIYPAFAAGGYLNYAFGKVSFQPELLFSHKGSSFLFPYFGYNKNARNNQSLNYLEIPLSFYYSINDDDATPYFGMGLAPAILLFEKNTVKYPTGTNISYTNANLNGVDLGYIFTAGYKMDKFFAEVRLNLGLARVYPNSNVRNSVFMIMGGMKLSK
jgi:hypothetical protein